MKFYPTELHTHTQHSDGWQTPAELVKAAEKLGLKALALTDHNTMSGLREIKSKIMTIINGIEWTTFFGHILVLEPDFYVDYRGIEKDDFDRSLKELRKADATVGIAHPFRLGNPFCTGCFFEYGVRDYGLIDYVEVWSMSEPAAGYENIRAVKFHRQLLSDGHRLAVTGGLDWHVTRQADGVFARTYVGIEDSIELSGKVLARGIKTGRTYITYGHTIDVTLDGEHIGGEVGSGKVLLSYSVSGKENLGYLNKNDITAKEIRVINNDKVIYSSRKMKDASELALEKGWIILEAHGRSGSTECPVLMTSAWYVV